MRVVVTGATGMIGKAAVSALLKREDQVIALTRDPDRARKRLGGRVQLHAWEDPKLTPPPRAALADADAVLHLLGEPIAQRWSTAIKKEIRESRVLSTRMLLAALREIPAGGRPHTLVAQSAIGYYGPRDGERLDESAGPGTDFLASVTSEWEAEASDPPPGVRVTLTRTGVVLSPSGGALAKMLPPFKLGVGDVIGSLLFCLDHEAAGAVNVTAPEPVTNAELARTLGRVLHRPAVLPVPALALKALYGEMATVILSGQRAVPGRLEELGYEFRFPELEDALRDVLKR